MSNQQIESVEVPTPVLAGIIEYLEGRPHRDVAEGIHHLKIAVQKAVEKQKLQDPQEDS